MSNLTPFQIVDDINNITRFLSKRDINELSCKALADKFGITQVDMIIILGNSMPYIAELGAKAYKIGLAKDIMIVGGIGHSTQYLIQNILQDNNYKDIDVNDKSEAEILGQIIVRRENTLQDKIIIEDKSTNCGSNASESLKILKRKGKIPNSIILIQDPTMQLRSHVSFLKEWEEEKPLIISYSPFIPRLKVSESDYEYINKDINGLWSKERFIDLIKGEIPRLRDFLRVSSGESDAMGIIDGADGPTAIFVATKIGGLSLEKLRLILILIFRVITTIWFLLKRVIKNKAH